MHVLFLWDFFCRILHDFLTRIKIPAHLDQSHELYILIGIIFNAVELSDLDDAAVARANPGDRLVVVDEVSLSF